VENPGQAMGYERADDATAQLRAAEQRIKELEAKVRYLEDRAHRAERSRLKSVEIEQNILALSRRPGGSGGEVAVSDIGRN